MTQRVVEHVTCLGCGCACDDISVVVQAGRVAAAQHACELGLRWFGDGAVPSEIRAGGRAVTLAAALAEAAKLLRGGRHPLVYLAADVSSETQRAAVAIADRLAAALDSPTSEIAPAVLAAQRRGRAAATLGEIRQRADLVVFWAVDPAARYPRYASRYALEPAGLQTPDGRNSRRVIAVDVGDARGPKDADARVAIAPDTEVDALALLRARVVGHAVEVSAPARPLNDLADQMVKARYVALVHDAEAADPDRAEALIALAQALNGPTRCALSSLRGGGNRSGADAVLTWQTGFPCAVEFGSGHPSFRPHAGAATLVLGGEVDTALVVGSPASVPDRLAQGLAALPVAAIGPRASAAAYQPRVAIDTGIAGIHEGGIAFRMDDVPLPLRPALDGGPPGAAEVVGALLEALG